jgi:uncharacterized protein with NRDE domain
MCTVSYIPVGDRYYITSNRDEKLTRKQAIAPQLYGHNGARILFPKDADAGGTWIAAKENGDAAVLLNGAFISHVPDPPYRNSRGLVLLDLFSQEKPADAFAGFCLDDIEPFTVVIFENKSLFEFRWDGNEKYERRLPADKPCLWSSSTLYDGMTVIKREKWFEEFLKKNRRPAQNTIINFHRFAGDGDAANDLLMSRTGLYNTVSITSIEINGNKTKMQYLDLRDNKTFTRELFYTHPYTK